MDANCFEGARLDSENIMDGPTIRRRRGEVDIRSLLQPLLESNPAVQRSLDSWIEPFCIEAKQSILKSLLAARDRSHRDEELSLILTNAAAHFYFACYRLGDDLYPNLTRERGSRGDTRRVSQGNTCRWARRQRGQPANLRSSKYPPSCSSRRCPGRGYWIMAGSREQALRKLYRERLEAEIESAGAAHRTTKQSRKLGTATTVATGRWRESRASVSSAFAAG